MKRRFSLHHLNVKSFITMGTHTAHMRGGYQGLYANAISGQQQTENPCTPSMGGASGNDTNGDIQTDRTHCTPNS